MSPDQKCYDFIKGWEGFKTTAYRDSAGIWTIGYGSILYKDHTPVKSGDVVTPEKAEELIEWEVNMKSKTVDAGTSGVGLNQNQYNALVSFAYNAGSGALLSSSLLRLVKANPSDPNIRAAFMMWDKAHCDGKLVEVMGLKNRRNSEADLYFSKLIMKK